MINLPMLEIPAVQLPMPIPELIHPAVVHFAIVLPIIILLIELFNTIFKKRALSVTSLLLIVLLTVIVFGAYLTGGVDGKNAYSLLSSDGKEVLKEHKLIGTYLVYGSAVVLFFKLISMIINAGFVRLLFILVLLGYTGSSLYQGKEGGELVYEYGSNIAPISEFKDEITELKETIEDNKGVEEKIAKLEKSVKDATTLKEENEKLKTQIETLNKEAEDSKKTLEIQIDTLKTKAKETKDSLEAQINTLKDEASKVVEVVTNTVTPTTETNSSAE